MSNNIKDDKYTFYQNDDYSRFSAADLKENEFGARGTHNHSTHGEAVPQSSVHDFTLGEEARALLMKNPSLEASEIIPSVQGETLTLRGLVKSEAEKKEAELCLKSIPEVSTVINELQIRR
jgi:osmotically-inducible protein OsmY